MSEVKIVHPYGKVGGLLWQEGSSSVVAPFGAGKTNDLWRIASKLRTFTESVTQRIAREAKDLIAEADTLVFVGFGYLRQNLELLTVDQSRANRVFLTTLGFSDTDLPLIRQDVSTVLNRASDPDHCGFAAFITRGTCADLMYQNRLRLSRPALPHEIPSLGYDL